MATLKISELSVGDWVNHENKEYRLYAIEECGLLRGKWESDEDLAHIAKHIDHFEPIPITAEILEANGFAKAQRGGFYHYLRLDKNRTLYIHASTNGWRVEVTYDAAGILITTHLMPDINSVHQLQHALRLARVDKEINL